MKLKYWFEMPNKWTFKQPKLLSFISNYIPSNSKVLIPFAGKSKFGSIDGSEFIYNDINPEIRADYHMNATELKNVFEKETFDCIITDPPFTYAKARTLYKNKSALIITKWRDTAFFLLKPNGIYIELGYDSNGLGKKRAMKIALGVCCLGALHHDILIVIQKKYNNLNQWSKK